MATDSFFKVVEHQYNKQLPFVVYSRPIDALIKYWLQNDDMLYTTKQFTESGFVFSPFNSSKESILFPESNCKHNMIKAEHVFDVKVGQGQIVENDKENAKSTHVKLVQRGLIEIKKGHLTKVVLSRVETKDISDKNPILIFKRLYNKYKNAMVYCWYHPKVGLWLGATPELLFKVEGRQLTAISLAATQTYKPVSKATVWTPKEIKEQQIVTDYLAQQLAPYTSCTNISEVETIRAGSLLHLKTRLISRIEESSNLKSIIKALHPTPAVCGFPKETAKNFILKHENYDREFYTGFLGELNLKQSKTRNTNHRNVENNAYTVIKTQSNFYVNLRCTQIKNGKALIYVGGGITIDSIAENEWQETVNKTKTIRNILS